jgi:hypothetical protein
MKKEKEINICSIDSSILTMPWREREAATTIDENLNLLLQINVCRHVFKGNLDIMYIYKV